jgi:argininosuccinate lyase
MIMTKVKHNKLWGSAFEVEPEKAVIDFTAGRDVIGLPAVDLYLLPYDILGDKAHCVMLYKTGIISKNDAKVILKGLGEIKNLADKSKFKLDPEKEDVHTNVESWLIEKYGIEIAGKLHTARSRNDQTNLDTRLYLKDQVGNFVSQLLLLNETLLESANKYKNVLMPGFTHHQHAMVTTFGHLMLMFSSMITRDAKRFTGWFDLHNRNPLGSMVSYGTSFPINRHLTSQLLGFDGPEANSLDEITNRWEAEADLAFAIAVLMDHFSLMAETLILFCTPQFGMVKIADQYSTGSSIMPQKKNPDSLEVIKGKASVAAGLLQGLMGMGKSNFIGYNRDSQWAKYLITDLVRECILTPGIVKGVIETLIVDEVKMEEWCNKGFIGTTTLLEQIASNYNLPFRKTKIVIEKAVKYSKDRNKVTYEAVKNALDEEKIKIKITEKEVEDWQNPRIILKLTKSFGSPGIASTNESIKILKEESKELLTWINKKETNRQKAENLLNEKIAEINT